MWRGQAAHSKWYGCGRSLAHPGGCWQRYATEDPRGAERPPGWIICSPRQEAIHKGCDGRVLARRIVDVVPPQSKVRRQESDTLRFASTVHPPRNQLSFAGKEGQEDPGGHGEEVKITHCWPGSGPAASPPAGQGVPQREQPTRQGEDPLWTDRRLTSLLSDLGAGAGGNEPPYKPVATSQRAVSVRAGLGRSCGVGSGRSVTPQHIGSRAGDG